MNTYATVVTGAITSILCLHPALAAAEECGSDLDGNGQVDGGDLTLLLGDWGGGESDLDGDGLVGGADLEPGSVMEGGRTAPGPSLAR